MNVTNKQYLDLAILIRGSQVYFEDIFQLCKFIDELSEIGFTIDVSNIKSAKYDFHRGKHISFQIEKYSYCTKFIFMNYFYKKTTHFDYELFLKEIKNILSNKQLDDYEVY